MITTRIQEEYQRVGTRVSGGHPDFLYLGKAEHSELVALAASFGFTPTQSFKHCGMTVIRVDAASHIGFGWEGPSPAG